MSKSNSLSSKSLSTIEINNVTIIIPQITVVYYESNDDTIEFRFNNYSYRCANPCKDNPLNEINKYITKYYAQLQYDNSVPCTITFIKSIVVIPYITKFEFDSKTDNIVLNSLSDRTLLYVTNDIYSVAIFRDKIDKYYTSLMPILSFNANATDSPSLKESQLPANESDTFEELFLEDMAENTKLRHRGGKPTTN